LTDTGFFGFLWIRTYNLLDGFFLDIGFGLICYDQSTSAANLLHPSIMGNSTTTSFLPYGFYVEYRKYTNTRKHIAALYHLIYLPALLV
jgi:hypothetical protein